MGFVGFLNFGLKCIQLLAWPSLALGYPLCASIRAVETNSKYHMRKLVTYWILFSLISLFELAFVKLIKWIPFWPFLKIIAISCLVLHRFTGAYYAYKWLVHLFLSVNLWQRVQDINWLNKKKELFLMRETFLAAAERYLDENGTEALEKLIASKSNSKVPNVAQNDINAVEHEKNVAAADKISNNKAPNVAQNDINAVEHEENVAATDKISNNKAPNVAQNDIHAVEHEENVAATDKIQSNNKVPNVAQNGINAVELEENVAATDKIQTNNKVPNVAQNDINAVEHEKNVAATDKISNSKVPNVAQNDINAVELEENVVATDKIQTNNKVPNVAQNDINVVEHKKNVTTTDKIVKHVDTNLSRTQQKLGISTEVTELTSAATVRDYVLPVPPTLRIQKEWTCAVCQVKTTCEVTFNSHLQGRKHKSKCEQLKSSMQAMKVQGSSSTASNQEPKKAVSGNRLGQKKTQKAEETAVKLEANVAATAKIFNSKVPNVAQNDINVMEHEENAAATDKISNNKAPNVAQNDINVVEPEENVAATYKISNIKASNVAHNDINAVEHEENVAATNKIQSKSNVPNIAQNDINAVEREENVAASDKIVKHVDINLSRTQQKLGTSTKEVTSATTVRDFVLPVPPTLRIRKDWTCAVCQVKTTCEVSLNSHLQGRKHKSKCEKLKSSIQAMKVEGSSSTASNQEPKKAVSGNRLCQNKTQKAEEKLKFDVNTTEQWKPRKPANAAAAAGIRESKYLFDMHNVSCSGEIDMAAHLNGRRHLSLLNEFDDILRVPNYGAMVPQGFNGLPNYGAVVPQGFNGVLNYGAMVPQAFNEVPNYGAMIPQAFNGVPNSGAMVPHDLNGVPNYGVMVPPAWD